MKYFFEILYLLYRIIIQLSHQLIYYLVNTKMSNISLYIKRAESFHTKEFIIEAFSSNNIGNVRDVKFIKKTGDFGKDYNGVIVTFENWCMNTRVTSLFDNMNASVDGTTKFIFDYISQRYWIINVFKSNFEDIKENEIEELKNINLNITDNGRIKELEKLVKSMSAQMHYMQTKQEKTEQMLMDYEHKETQFWLQNFELKSQLEEKDIEFKYYENKFNETFTEFEEEIGSLKCKVACLAIENIKKDREYEELRQNLYDESSVLAFVEEQAREMREMLKLSGQTKPYINKERLD